MSTFSLPVDPLRAADLRLEPAAGRWTLRWLGAAANHVEAWLSGCRVAAGAEDDHAPPPVAALQQVHSASVTRVMGPGLSPACDAAVTTTAGLMLVVRVADCVPLFLVSPRGIGVAHAGWRGTVAEIGRRTVEELAALTGDEPDAMQAFIGPSIGPCCFEVGAEVAEAFPAAFRLRPPPRWLGARRGAATREHVDLWAANADQLLRAGLRPDRVRQAGLCTRCHQHLFHSYRGSGGQPGRIECNLRRTPPTE